MNYNKLLLVILVLLAFSGLFFASFEWSEYPLIYDRHGVVGILATKLGITVALSVTIAALYCTLKYKIGLLGKNQLYITILGIILFWGGG